jgi:N-acetylglucosamine-6-phosphate deacetylase
MIRHGSAETASVRCLIAGRVFAPEEIPGPVAVIVSNGRIQSIHAKLDRPELPDGCEVDDLRPWSLAPGFIDLHTHGFGGHDVTSGTEGDVLDMARKLPSTGVTAFYATIASTGPRETRRQVARVAQAAEDLDKASSRILGIRLEGPYISHAKRGAQFEPSIRRPDPDELEMLAGQGPIRMLDFAPEEDTEFRLLRRAVELGINPSIGHTAATYAQSMAAIEAGARHCAHLFNAMPVLDHRAPGAVGALLTDTLGSVEIVADGVHVHPAMLRLAIAARGPARVALVTDAMPAAGEAPGRYTFLEREIVVADGAVRLPDGTLAGSVLTLDRAVRNMIAVAGVNASDAIRMATLTPACTADVPRKGRLSPGADADLVALDEHMSVQRTWIGGCLAFALGHEEGVEVCLPKALY